MEDGETDNEEGQDQGDGGEGDCREGCGAQGAALVLMAWHATVVFAFV